MHTMASPSEPLNPDFPGAPNQSGSPDAGQPHSAVNHPHLSLPSALRVKTAVHDRMAAIQFNGRSDDKATSNEGHAASLPPQTTTNNATPDATKESANDTIARCDNNDIYDSNGAAPPTAAAGPSVPHILLPLMPAMIGPTMICSAEVWSKDPNFMMYCYKITPCTHRTPHDWRVCPWAHPNERASRRCTRMFAYASVPCANARSGRPCAKGTACEYSHNVTEYWLHPNRYRAERCSLGLRCNRRLCFFAHTDVEMRSADVSAAHTAPPAAPPAIPPQPHASQAPYLDLLAHPATILEVLQGPARPTEQLQRQQQQQQLNQQQQSLFDASSLVASASTDGARQHEIMQMLMTAVAPPLSVLANSQTDSASAADPDLMRRHQQLQHHHQQQQRQSSISAVPAFCDLLGSVTPAPPVATQFAPAFFEPNYMFGASSAELIAAIIQGLPTV